MKVKLLFIIQDFLILKNQESSVTAYIIKIKLFIYIVFTQCGL